MRSYLIIVALAAAPPAQACPTGALCAAANPGSAGVRSSADALHRSIDTAAREEAPAAPKRTQRISLRIDRVPDRDPWNLDEPPPAVEVDAMPWIWQQLRRSVYDRMPRYRDDSMSFVLSPVVVAGSFDTVPGVGIAGDF